MVIQMSWKGTLREMSEKHVFDPDMFKAGVFAVGAEYKGVLIPKDKWIASLREMSEPHDFDPDDFQAGAFAVGAEYKGVIADKGWKGNLEDVT